MLLRRLSIRLPVASRRSASDNSLSTCCQITSPFPSASLPLPPPPPCCLRQCPRRPCDHQNPGSRMCRLSNCQHRQSRPFHASSSSTRPHIQPHPRRPYYMMTHPVPHNRHPHSCCPRCRHPRFDPQHPRLKRAHSSHHDCHPHRSLVSPHPLLRRPASPRSGRWLGRRIVGFSSNILPRTPRPKGEMPPPRAESRHLTCSKQAALCQARSRQTWTTTRTIRRMR